MWQTNIFYITIGCLFSRATILWILDFHETCFTENYRKSYRDTDCRLKRNVDSWKLFPQISFYAKLVALEKGILQYQWKFYAVCKRKGTSEQFAALVISTILHSKTCILWYSRDATRMFLSNRSQNVILNKTIYSSIPTSALPGIYKRTEQDSMLFSFACIWYSSGFLLKSRTLSNSLAAPWKRCVSNSS